MSETNELSSYEIRMEKMDAEFNAWWDDWGDNPEEVEESAAFYNGVSREVAQAIFTAGYRLGGHVPWMSMSPLQLATLAKLYVETRNVGIT